MKKTTLFTAFLSLTFSLNCVALGLGSLIVSSSLDEPFNAEIELLDVGSIPLSGIQSNLASVEDYRRVGIEQSPALNYLTFVVETNQHGHPIIHIRSIERISDPFIQLFVDMTWAKGQVFREYSVLLDPSDYELHAKKTRPSTRLVAPPHRDEMARKVVEERVVVQPSRERSFSIQTEPVNVMAVETPLPTELPVVPTVTRSNYLIPKMDSFLMALDDFASKNHAAPLPAAPVDRTLKAQMDITTSAIESIRESNSTLKEQLEVMRDHNKLLQDQLRQRDESMVLLREQVELLMRRQGIAGQVISSDAPHSHSTIWLWTLMLLAASSGAFFAWKKQTWPISLMRDHFEKWLSAKSPSAMPLRPITSVKSDVMKPTESSLSKKQPIAPPTSPLKEGLQEGGAVPVPLVPLDKKALARAEQRQQAAEKSLNSEIAFAQKPEMIEFVMPTEPPMEIKKETSISKSSVKKTIAKDQAQAIEFAPMNDEAPLVKIPVKKPVKKPVKNVEPPLAEVEKESVPVKSQAALDTILSLAKTYLDMGDKDAAKLSLEEVLHYGNEKQKKAAQELMDIMK